MRKGELASFAVTIPAPSQKEREGTPDGICAWSGEPSEVVVQIQSTFGGVGVRRYAQPSLRDEGDDDLMGYVRIKYGCGAVRNVIDVDMISQSIALPVCDFVEVSARQFTTSLGSANDGTDLSVVVSAGRLTGDPVAPTSTILRVGLAVGTTTDTLSTVNKARWMYIVPYADTALLADDLTVAVELTGSRIDMGSGDLPSQFPGHAFWPIPPDDEYEITSVRTAAGSNGYMLQYYIGP